MKIISRKVKKFLSCERGTQMLEFAFLLPFLLLFFASTVEMGRMFYTYTTLTKTTEVGARYLSTKFLAAGAYSGTDSTTATNLVVCGRTACTGQTPIAQNLAAGNVTITPPGTGTGTRYVTVQVTYAYQPLIFNLSNLTGQSGLSLNFTFTPSTRMRYLL